MRSPEARFAGRYNLQDAISIGTSSTVYRGIEAPSNTLVAVKIFNPNRDERKDSPEDEARIHAQLQHKNIIPFRWYSVQGEHPYIVTMLANQGSLAARIAKKGPLTIDQVAQIAVEAATGAQHIHDQGYVHRDLKPSNILLHESPESTVRVTDLGSAIPDRPEKSTGTKVVTVGTLEYLAPEQFDGVNTPASDIYALGITLFEAAAGKVPFKKVDTRQIIAAHAHTPVPPLERYLGSLMTDVHAAVEQPIRKALAKDPGDRQASMAELADEVRESFERAQGTESKDRTIIDVRSSPRPRQEAPIEVLPLQPVAPRTLEDEPLPDEPAELSMQSAALQRRLDAIRARLREKEAEEITDPLLAAEKAHPMIERAKEILGEDFLGIEAIRGLEEKLKRGGHDVEFLFDELPEFPYTEEDLQIAKTLGERLVLRPEMMMRGIRETRLSLYSLREILNNEGSNLPKIVVENLTYNFNDSKLLSRYNRHNTIISNWALIGSQPISGAKDISYPYDGALGEVSRGLERKGAANFQVRVRTALEIAWDTVLTYPQCSPVENTEIDKYTYKAGDFDDHLSTCIFDVKYNFTGNSDDTIVLSEPDPGSFYRRSSRGLITNR